MGKIGACSKDISVQHCQRQNTGRFSDDYCLCSSGEYGKQSNNDSDNLTVTVQMIWKHHPKPLLDWEKC